MQRQKNHSSSSPKMRLGKFPWSDPKQELQTFSIITTAANPMVAKIHNRMPVILHQADYDKWLREPDESLLKPFPENEMDCYRVNPFVNSSRNEGEKCVEPWK